jgi:hypothetical protein
MKMNRNRTIKIQAIILNNITLTQPFNLPLSAN